MSHVAAPGRSPSPSPALRSLPVLTALAHKAEQSLRDVVNAHHAFLSSRTTRLHGALALAVAHAQHVLTALETVREQRERQRQQQQKDQQKHNEQDQPSSTPFTNGATARASSPAQQPQQRHGHASPAPSREELSLYVRLDKVRIDLRRVLPRAVAAVEDGDANADGSPASSSRSAASTAAALRSLLHTRSMLSVELQKMDAAVQGLAGSGESLAQLQHSLEGVHSSMATAQLMVRKLLTVQSRDDLLLRISAVLFALVILYVVAQRVFRFFPATVYVTVSEDSIQW